MANRIHIILLLIFTVVPAYAWAEIADSGCTLYVMPCPKKIVLTNDVYVVKPTMNIFIEGMSKKRKDALLTRINTQLSRLKTTFIQRIVALPEKRNADIVVRVHSGTVHTQQRPQISTNIAYQHPTLDDDESYDLTITPSLISIDSNTDFGVLHGWSTLLQLLVGASSDLDPGFKRTRTSQGALVLPSLTIVDQPKYKWRGLLIDSVRHFMPISHIKRQLDGMAAAKLNVFHWHLNDDQGWRIESKHYPKLHERASDNMFYSQSDIKAVVDYASLLGIRVVPEFDIPGHASAIAVAYPDLMAEKKDYAMERQWGVFEPVLDVSNPKVYLFIEAIINEFVLLFPDSYIHIGGDEVKPKQWLENKNIQQLMVTENLATSDDIHHYFNLRVQAILAKYDRKMMGWDEIYHPELPQDIVIQSWRGLESMNNFANQGYQGVLSTGFYIDQPQYSAYHYRNHPERPVPAFHNAMNIEPKQTNVLQGWNITIPRLKGSSVSGELLLVNVNDEQNNAARGFLKLNNNAFEMVNVLATNESAQYVSNPENTLVFTVDSWMGPLRFELAIGVDKLHHKHRHRLFIGNSYYPFYAQKISQEDTANMHATMQTRSPLNAQNKHNILGGEATLWSEMVTYENIDLRTWPRLFVIAERLWSQASIRSLDNLYKRLFFIDSFAHNIVGILHKKQRKNGFANLLGKSNNPENLRELTHFSQMYEPAHYYTRHHIKYQQNKYNQLAPLNEFVDFLPVESFSVIKLNNLVKAHSQGVAEALPSIASTFNRWQKSVAAMRGLAAQDASIARLIPLIDDAHTLTSIAQQIITGCSDDNGLAVHSLEAFSHNLAQLEEQQHEAVLAAVLPIRALMAACQSGYMQIGAGV